MNVLQKLSSPLLLKTGKYTFVVAVLAVVLNVWGIIPLKEEVPWLLNALCIYLLLNVLIATPFYYLEKKSKAAVNLNCPQCGQTLETSPKYICPNCGELEFKKQE